jgi:hypothetical protein
MDSIETPRSEIPDPLLQGVYDYWDRTRGERRMPSRAQVDPSEMRFVLSHLMLIDVMQPASKFRVRLQGTEVAWWLGTDLTGKMLDELRPPDLRSLIGERFVQCIAFRAPFYKAGRHLINGLPRLLSTLILPLSADDRNVDKLLVVLRCAERAW